MIINATGLFLPLILRRFSVAYIKNVEPFGLVSMQLVYFEVETEIPALSRIVHAKKIVWRCLE